MNRQMLWAVGRTTLSRISACAAKARHRLRTAQQHLRRVIVALRCPAQRVQTIHRVIYTERVQLPLVRIETSAGYAESYEEHVSSLGAVRISVTQEASQAERLELPILGVWFTRKRMVKRIIRHGYPKAGTHSPSHADVSEQ